MRISAFLVLFLVAPLMKLSAAPPSSLYDYQVHALDGTPVDLGKYKGQVTLVVTVASHCGFTPQYAGLEQLSKDYDGKGFVILGFPSDDFGGQEPGTPQQIATFCSTKYNVTFPLFEKVDVKGAGQAPVYNFSPMAFRSPRGTFANISSERTAR
jgi:glutathione peroxidase